MFSNQPNTPQGLPIPTAPRTTYASPSYTIASRHASQTSAAGATA